MGGGEKGDGEGEMEKREMEKGRERRGEREGEREKWERRVRGERRGRGETEWGRREREGEGGWERMFIGVGRNAGELDDF